MMSLTKHSASLTQVQIGINRFYFSYEALIAHSDGVTLHINKYYIGYSKTTSKHFNQIKIMNEGRKIVELDDMTFNRYMSNAL